MGLRLDNKQHHVLYDQNTCTTAFLSGAGQASNRPLADSVSDCFICFSLGGLRWFSIANHCCCLIGSPSSLGDG
ncbi:hypothetical protein EBR43_04615 [bacterium]|nr:hypothetical protein [bacterium]NBX71876.1 hypothetical protein [bacterium]